MRKVKQNGYCVKCDLLLYLIEIENAGKSKKELIKPDF